jgi:hypothetical protein
MNELNPPPTGESPVAGTPIGYVDQAGVRPPVLISPCQRMMRVHIIGRAGTGKWILMERMILDDIRRGEGVAVLDPHGGLIERLLRLASAPDVPRVVYFNPGEPKCVPIWNPLRYIAGLPPSRVADDLVGAFRSFMTGWGDRLEHRLRHAMLGVLHLPDGNLLDMANLLRQKPNESEELRARSSAASYEWSGTCRRTSRAQMCTKVCTNAGSPEGLRFEECDTYDSSNPAGTERAGFEPAVQVYTHTTV